MALPIDPPQHLQTERHSSSLRSTEFRNRPETSSVGLCPNPGAGAGAFARTFKEQDSCSSTGCPPGLDGQLV